MNPMQHFHLWGRTLADQSDGFDPQRGVLRQALLDSRERASSLVGEISRSLPSLTLHDISHLDALWRVADQIIGPEYPVNPAEAFVLGEAFLMHDAAHVVAAYSGGIAEIQNTLIWKDIVAQKFFGIQPREGSAQEQHALFLVLRELHAMQAHELPKLTWKVPGKDDELSLIPNYELREYYGDVIGEIAKSHHWSPNQTAEVFADRQLNAPACIAPANWTVDAMKVAFILRTADAAHIDGQRAPWFLFALRKPAGISEDHWNFQAKMGQPTLTSSGELRISSGSPFKFSECQSWWLAFDTARMIDRELHEAKLLLQDNDRPIFAATSVSRISSPEAFSSQVRTVGWEPVDVSPTISDVPKIIRVFGGAKLYGEHPELALRELIQNAADAVRALRILRPTSTDPGRIEVELNRQGGDFILSVTDSGIGMSRHVLTRVLPDFGNSLWSSETLHSELPGLASNGFKSTGQFGIGFYSTFMLGEHVQVTSKRYKKAEDDTYDQWTLAFSSALSGRPILRRATNEEDLPSSGTRVSVKISEAILKKLLLVQYENWAVIGLGEFGIDNSTTSSTKTKKTPVIDASATIKKLCPTINIDVYLKIGSSPSTRIIENSDWKHISDEEVLARTNVSSLASSKGKLLELRELNGDLVGRLTYGSNYFSAAVVAHNGIMSGKISNLAGVALGNNNSDLARSTSTPIASKEAWTSFASKWISENASTENIDGLKALHPLARHIDVKIWKLDNSYVSLENVKAWILGRSSIHVHAGDLTHEDSDDLSSHKFYRNLICDSNTLFTPTADGSVGIQLGFEKINYIELLEELLREIWGAFDEDQFDEQIVGEVEGVEILRSITTYSRPEA